MANEGMNVNNTMRFVSTKIKMPRETTKKLSGTDQCGLLYHL